MRNLLNITLCSAVLLLSACESDPDTALQDSLSGSSIDGASVVQTLSINASSQAVGSGTTASLYDPGNAVLPSAIDILFKDSLDGTLNIPIDSGDPQAAAKTVLSAMDGFATSVPITTGFSAAIDASTITGSAVRVFEVGLSGFAKAVVSVKNELTFGVDFVATLASVDPLNTTLAIVPLKPLKPDTSYYVVITNSLKDTSGDSVVSSSVYSLAKSSTAQYVNSAGVSQLTGVNDEDAATLETLRQLVSASEFTVDFAKEDLAATNIVVSWSFTTQSAGKTLATVRSIVGTPTSSLMNSTAIVGASGPGRSVLGAANMHEGTLTVPYYLTEPSAGDPTANLTKHWNAANSVGDETNLTRLNSLPAATNSVEIPVLVTTPFDTATFPAPWKTVIFQHGITTNRSVMLAVADSLAQAGFAVVAIDMPLHGLKAGHPLYQQGKERTFDVDFVTEDSDGNTTAAAPDSVVDSSGKHFINLSDLLVTRDNVRQAVADLFALTAAIPTMDVDDDGNADLDGSNIYFVGHSLGAMIGTTFLALETNVKDAVLVNGGIGYAKVLDGSAAFSPTIVAGLKAATSDTVDKLAVGAARAAYESFIAVAQIAVNTADPVNHSAAAASNRGMLFFEIVGDGSPLTSDLVVPNTVPDANDTLVPNSGITVASPLAGTEPQLTLMGLTHVNSSQSGTDLKLSVKFTEGSHSSLLDPSPDVNPSAAVTTEMQTQIVSFLASDGNALTVTNSAILQAP